MEGRFDLQEYINREAPGFDRSRRGEEVFAAVCEVVRRSFDAEWEKTEDRLKNIRLEREKKAIIGYEREVRYYKEKIRGILREKKLTDAWCPPWFPDLTEAVFAELYGLSGLAPWAYDMQEKYRDSSSAKLIGERLYCLIDGKTELQPQRIPERRREQLKRSLLLATPEERVEYGFHEVYLQNGIRITIYAGDRTKKGQDVMVFRKYVLRELTFEKLAELRTIPPGAVPLFRALVKLGPNVIMSGQVRSGKTTFLQTWQRYEDPGLEGLAVATDPETPWHRIMPDAPIMQLVADGEQLAEMTRSLMRGDNDYILLEEMRDACAYKLALDITSTGTRRSKATIHCQSAAEVPYRMAQAVAARYGGNANDLVASVYRNFDLIIELTQDPEDRARKIMTGITALSRDEAQDICRADRICSYDREKDVWLWNARLPAFVLRSCGDREDAEKAAQCLQELAAGHPMVGETTIYPAYYHREGGQA